MVIRGQLGLSLVSLILSAVCFVEPTSAQSTASDPENETASKPESNSKPEPTATSESTAKEQAAKATATVAQTVATRSREAARKKGEITFDDLKFDIEKGGEFNDSMLTSDIKSLNKQTVRIRGYILPNSVYKSSGIDQFVLVRDNQECCFGPGAAIYDCVLVDMEKGKTTDFTTKAIAVRGKLEIKELRFPDGTLMAIYKMVASEAK